jgi:hypothetical protein
VQIPLASFQACQICGTFVSQDFKTVDTVHAEPYSFKKRFAFDSRIFDWEMATVDTLDAYSASKISVRTTYVLFSVGVVTIGTFVKALVTGGTSAERRGV